MSSAIDYTNVLILRDFFADREIELEKFLPDEEEPPSRPKHEPYAPELPSYLGGIGICIAIELLCVFLVFPSLYYILDLLLPVSSNFAFWLGLIGAAFAIIDYWNRMPNYSIFAGMVMIPAAVGAGVWLFFQILLHALWHISFFFADNAFFVTAVLVPYSLCVGLAVYVIAKQEFKKEKVIYEEEVKPWRNFHTQEAVDSRQTSRVKEAVGTICEALSDERSTLISQSKFDKFWTLAELITGKKSLSLRDRTEIKKKLCAKQLKDAANPWLIYPISLPIEQPVTEELSKNIFDAISELSVAMSCLTDYLSACELLRIEISRMTVANPSAWGLFSLEKIPVNSEELNKSIVALKRDFLPLLEDEMTVAQQVKEDLSQTIQELREQSAYKDLLKRTQDLKKKTEKEIQDQKADAEREIETARNKFGLELKAIEERVAELGHNNSATEQLKSLTAKIADGRVEPSEDLELLSQIQIFRDTINQAFVEAGKQPIFGDPRTNAEEQEALINLVSDELTIQQLLRDLYEKLASCSDNDPQYDALLSDINTLQKRLNILRDKTNSALEHS